ncbi:MAG: hypothetical protein WCI74_07740, partial [Actinomycetes bacterium]
MQYDPGYAGVDPAFGKALLLRLWGNGSECGTPVARAKMPAGIDTNGPHQFTVILKGDTLYAQVDGITLFNVPSLTQAVANSHCSMSVPTGTQVGFRSWSADTNVTFHNTQLN